MGGCAGVGQGKAMRNLKKTRFGRTGSTNEVVVAAYGAKERALGSYYYLENQLRFPFEARSIAACHFTAC